MEANPEDALDRIVPSESRRTKILDTSDVVGLLNGVDSPLPTENGILQITRL